MAQAADDRQLEVSRTRKDLERSQAAAAAAAEEEREGVRREAADAVAAAEERMRRTQREAAAERERDAERERESAAVASAAAAHELKIVKAAAKEHVAAAEQKQGEYLKQQLQAADNSPRSSSHPTISKESTGRSSFIE